MSTTVDLDFHDSGGDDVLFDQSSGQTHTFHNFPASAVDDEEIGDKSQLLKEEEDGKKAPSFWTFEYYQQFFDVETRQVLHRVTGSMLPMPKRNYLHMSIRPNPDLYGPFWICTTLVFTTAIAGNLANYLSSGGKDYHWKYDFHKVTFAATAIFSYWWLIPGIMYSFLWWRKSQAGYTFLEILCVYGYSLAIYIPISILWVINITWFKWVLVIVGAVMSGGVLVITFWPAVKEDTKNIAFTFIGLIFLFHLGLAAGFVLYFFHVPPQAAVTVQTTPVPTNKPMLQEALKSQLPKDDAAIVKDKLGADKPPPDKLKPVGGDNDNAPVKQADNDKAAEDHGDNDKAAPTEDRADADKPAYNDAEPQDAGVLNEIIDNADGPEPIGDNKLDHAKIEDAVDNNKVLTKKKRRRNAVKKEMDRQKA